MSNILKPVPMQYPPKATTNTSSTHTATNISPTPGTPGTPSATTPNGARKSESFFERVRNAWNIASAPKESVPVRVRLINDWSDVNMSRINIVVCNFLYDEKSKSNSMWRSLEEATTFRREQIFYAASLFFAYVLMVGNFIASLLIVATVLLPVVCTFAALNEANTERMQLWLKYWTVYGIIAFVEYLIQRFAPDADVRIIKFVLLGACMSPFLSILGLLFETFNKPFRVAKDNFEQYNYQIMQ